jgi:hypothetical protein
MWTIRWRRRVLAVLAGTITGLTWVLKHGFGRHIDASEPYASITGYEKDQLLPPNRAPGSTVHILSYETSRNVAYTFALLFVVLAIVWRALPWKPASLAMVTHLFSNPLFALCAAMLTLGFMDHVVPAVLWRALRRLVLIRKSLFGRTMVDGLSDAFALARVGTDELPR